MSELITRRAGILALAGAVAAATTTVGSLPAAAASGPEIDGAVDLTMQHFYSKVADGHGLVQRAAAALVFPSVVKAGLGVGGEYGEGALRINGRTVEYYNMISASIGFQLGVQARAVVILFMTPDALRSFQRRAGWKIGVDGSVALVTLGAGGAVDTNSLTKPVIGFILDQKGLMYNLTLEGSKISRIRR